VTKLSGSEENVLRDWQRRKAVKAKANPERENAKMATKKRATLAGLLFILAYVLMYAYPEYAIRIPDRVKLAIFAAFLVWVFFELGLLCIFKMQEFFRGRAMDEKRKQENIKRRLRY
jgi:hypothetical protein